MSAGQTAAAHRCVLGIAESPQGAIFGRPVGPEAPGYRRVVRRPMDLGTVAARLQDGGYTTTGVISYAHLTPPNHAAVALLPA